MSEIRPKVTSSDAVTRLYPKRIQRRYWNEERGSICSPLKIAGREMSTMVPSREAISIAMVVLESTIHLYCKRNIGAESLGYTQFVIEESGGASDDDRPAHLPLGDPDVAEVTREETAKRPVVED